MSYVEAVEIVIAIVLLASSYYLVPNPNRCKVQIRVSGFSLTSLFLIALGILLMLLVVRTVTQHKTVTTLTTSPTLPTTSITTQQIER